MSLPESTTVLIVGAGPAGLTAALSLIHHGCRDFVIVDAVAEGHNTSRAIIIHVATVEALTSIDAADDLISRSIKGNGFRVASRTSGIIETRFDSLREHTAHPYALIIPQNVTEFVLGQKLQSLGVQVQRPHKVVGMQRNGEDARVTDVTFEDGQVIRARYIMGADGARSVVRSIAGIGFSDPPGSKLARNIMAQMVAVDIMFDRKPVGIETIEGHINVVISSNGFFLLAPFGTHFNADLMEDGKSIMKPIFRIVFSIPIDNVEPSHAPSKEYIQNMVDASGPACISSDPSVNPTPVKVDQVIWSSRFRTRATIADRTFTRLGAAILLVGDAAHIHAPTGGQGMNLGIRDAIFLAEAVAKHIQVSAKNPDVDDTILEEIAKARHARALEIIGYTLKLVKLASCTYHAYAWWMPFSQASLRDFVLRIGGRFEFVRSGIAWGLSGLGRR